MALRLLESIKARLPIFGTSLSCVQVVWNSDRRLLLLLILTHTISGIIPILTITINAKVLAIIAAIALNESQRDFYSSNVWQLIIVAGLLSGFALITSQISESIQRLLQRRISHYTQTKLIAVSAFAETERYSDPAFCTSLKIANNESQRRPFQLVQQLMQLFQASISLVALGIIIMQWSWLILPLAAIGPLLLLKARVKYSQRQVALVESTAEDDRLAQLLKSFLLEGTSAAEVRSWCMQPTLTNHIRRLWSRMFDGEVKLAYDQISLRALSTAILTLDRPAFQMYAAFRLASGHLTFSEYCVFTQALASFHSSIQSFASALSQMNESQIFLERVFEFEREPTDKEQKVCPKGCSDNTPRNNISILNLEKVSYKYPNSERFALKNISFTINSGEIVALAGRNGSGKTTITKLIAHLFEPQSGDIQLFGKSYKQLCRRCTRKHMSFMLQDFKLLPLSIFENVTISEDEHYTAANTARFESIAQLTGLNAIAAKLPQGYASRLNQAFTSGVELSGGQRQIVALSRALFRQSRLILLDEPTAALDATAERNFLDTIFEIARKEQIGILIVTHRMSTVKRSDRIIVIDDGSIVEVGSHADLIGKGGLYSQMYCDQASSFTT